MRIFEYSDEAVAVSSHSDGKQLGKFKRHEAHSRSQLSTHAATDDRCANFSASPCPPQPLQLIASSEADKLPLEKFHRLLDLVFWGKFLKFDSVSCFVFLWDVYRVSLNPVASERANRGRGENNNPEPPPAHVLILDMFTLSTTVYHVLQRLTLFTLSTTVYSVLQRLR